MCLDGPQITNTFPSHPCTPLLSLCIAFLKFISPQSLLFLLIYLLHPYNCGLISQPYSLWGYDCPSGPMCPLLPPTTCVLWPFPARPAPPGLPQGVPQAGRASLEGGEKLSVTRDKDPLDSPAYPMIPLSSHGGEEGWRGVSSLHAQTMLFQVYSCFGVCACVCLRLHTLLQPAVDVAHFLACASVIVYPR